MSVIFYTENLAFLFTDKDPNIIYKATLPQNIDADTTLAFTTVYDLGQDIDNTGITYDPVEQFLYWADDSNDVISKCDLNGGSYSKFNANGKLSGPRSFKKTTSPQSVKGHDHTCRSWS